MNSHAEIRQQVVVWALVCLVWALIVLAFAGPLVLRGDLDWGRALEFSLRDWLPWAFLTPVVAWLAFKFPLDRQHLSLSLPLHLASCIAAIMLWQVLAGPSPRPAIPREHWVARPGEPPPIQHLPELPPDLRRRPLSPRAEGRGERDLMGIIGPRAQFNLPVYWIIVSIVHAFRYHKRSLERERKAQELEASLTQARLEALRMQLNPHFLFNTLNAISTLVHRDPKAADEMIGNLSELLRATLNTSGEQEISLERELQFLNDYLEIQQARFGQRLRVSTEIDAGALNLKVPTMILQPLVENAIRHGIEPNSEPGLLQVSAAARDGTLRILIRDNGPGLHGKERAAEGIGLANSRARLQALYGPDGKLTLSSSPESGCVVELQIPARPA